MKIRNIAAVIALLCGFFSQAIPALEVGITANGARDGVTAREGSLIGLQISLNPGNHRGAPADWWAAAVTPFGLFWYTAESGWIPSTTPVLAYSGPLVKVANYSIYSGTQLPLGNYTIYFGVDLVQNGQLDIDQLSYRAIPLAVIQNDFKENIRLVVMSVNNYLLQINNFVLHNFVVECDLSGSLDGEISLNNKPHTTHIDGKLKLYDRGHLLDCNDLYYSDDIFIDKAEAEGSGYITGDEISANFRGYGTVVGSAGYIVKWDYSDLWVSDFLIINGSGIIDVIKYKGIWYPGASGTAQNITINVAEAVDLISEMVFSGNIVTLGDLAVIVKDGTVYGQTAGCDVTVHFNGTKYIDGFSTCMSPNQFKVDLDTSGIVY